MDLASVTCEAVTCRQGTFCRLSRSGGRREPGRLLAGSPVAGGCAGGRGRLQGPGRGSQMPDSTGGGGTKAGGRGGRWPETERSPSAVATRAVAASVSASRLIAKSQVGVALVEG
jgi:hypothetical protein